MPKICYVPKTFTAEHARLIALVNQIVAAYQAQGYDMTLRQVYYQMVARDEIPNNVNSYKRLADIIDQGRLAGLIDWEAIVDRTRNLRGLSHWETPGAVIESAAYSYRIDKWETQPARVEVWVEKDALVGVVARACDALDVPYFSCRGYTSSSEMWQAAQRARRNARRDQQHVILHLGDHDPSGRDMSRDIRDRMRLFEADVEFHRLALNMEQIEEYDPPPNPAKLTDSRAAAYIEEFGAESWELDALEPSVIAALITENVRAQMDADAFDEATARETDERRQLNEAAERWDEVVALLG